MASPALPALRRALLYVPASSPSMLSKSLRIPADNLTYDLEDSVTPSLKPTARTALQAHLNPSFTRPTHIHEIAVRINAINTPHALADLAAIASLPAVDTVVVPKVNSASDLLFVADALAQLGGGGGSSTNASSTTTSSPFCRRRPINLLALIETARGVMDLRSICGATPQLKGLIFAAEDFALDLSIRRTPGLGEFQYARSAIVTAARAFGLESAIDLVCTSFRGAEGRERLETECENGREMGFNGKQCIHPDQVGVVQRMFSPPEEEVEWAVRLVIADEKAAAAGRGAWTLDGKMVDAPVSGKARAIIAKAERCGMDIDHFREKWKDQEPE
ncbi:hypothetical protein VTI74DRAFT_462 [Chaetomium olivicolor]